VTKAAQRTYVYGSGENTRLIRGTHPDSIKSFATKDVPVRVASQDDLIELAVKKGITVEQSRPDVVTLPLNLEPAAA
jgi:hypothetical protein